MSMRARLFLVSALGGAIALLSPSSALAKTSFPNCIQAFFCGSVPGSERCMCPPVAPPPMPPRICQNLDTPPPCRVCHIQGTTASGTIQTPFGVSMLAHGLSGDNTSVCAALSTMTSVDSDGDGRTDLAEIQNLDDPNTAAQVSWLDQPTPTYGCAIGAGGRWLLATVSTLAGLVVLTRRRRRRSQPR
jgi:hypothetical protein